MSSLNVVCLISGGKDSLFSILHCLHNGHRIIAIANLYPPTRAGEENVEDMDSYMYQTVGHTIIPLYEQALGLPLYRQEIKGSAVNQDKCYGANSDDDETEALIPLLRKVKAQHPEVNAVSAGAILSDYQRTRVESVAIRLGLIPLSYLWQWPNLLPHTQDTLLRNMAEVGQDSRIIKVASGGLDESVLWQNVADAGTIVRLNRAVQRFGGLDDGAVLGEGGEYETLALSGPKPLWKGRIVVRDEDRKVVCGEAGSSSTYISKATVELGTYIPDLNSLHEPSLLEPRFQTVLQEIQDGSGRETGNQSQNAQTAVMELEKSSQCMFIADLVGDGGTVAEQMRTIMEQAAAILQDAGHSLRDVAYTSIVLRDMAAFGSVNAVYGSFFDHPNPPARATVACANVLKNGEYVKVAVTSFKDGSAFKKGLHVQSRSYWAPANIGPYSQAIAVPARNGSAQIYVAGQIPLVPASMELATVDDNEHLAFTMQAVLALQHLERIGRATAVRKWAGAVALVTDIPQQSAAVRSRYAHRAWVAYHRSRQADEDTTNSDHEDESFDVWHTKFGSQRGPSHHGITDSFSNFSAAREKAEVPSLHVILVDSLPRGSSIEWIAFGLTDDKSESVFPHLQHLLELFRKNIV